ncbi:MAG: PhzF family phenazine biosynthesis protein [Desulfobacter sp.]|nr:PhzF family phenazine biosynthesis protein [Desulfobacter sp.]WDP86500.1 MAG: PhzF family phenazine biosynthesis protein [Desulfobacter sp.]
MKLRMFQIDAFTQTRFRGNPAAVCPLDKWLPDSVLQSIAMENNLSETAFYVENSHNTYDLRWFTPEVEVDLCGHATLATAFVLAREFCLPGPFVFHTRSGPLTVTCNADAFVMDFPCQPPIPCDLPDALVEGLDVEIKEVLRAEDYLVVLETEAQVRSLVPNHEKFADLDLRGIIVTAPGDKTDFISRWFGIGVGVAEDPVTGSAHTTLTPYWAERLGKTCLTAKQVSARSGYLDCELGTGAFTGRVIIRGRAVKYMDGWIYLDDSLRV